MRPFLRSSYVEFYLSCLVNAQLNVKPGGGGHADQSIKTKQVNFAAHKIGYPGLGDPKMLRGFCLSPAVAFDARFNRNHQR